MESDSLCQYLNWDSEFFKRRIARVTITRITQDEMQRVIGWCKTHLIDCLYFLTDPGNADTVKLAENNGFRLVDIRITFEKKLENHTIKPDKNLPEVIRLCAPGDVPVLRAIARESHHDSRFYYDSNFSRAQCDALYETWIENSCNGYANAVLVTELKGRPVGYISCHRLDQSNGLIGLLGVSANAQGKGLGQRLVNESIRWFAEQGITAVTVVTQGRNYAAQRLYQSSRFLTRSLQLWYHRWFPLESSTNHT